MINDGGAERMVRNRKVEWWQIVAIAVMFVFVGITFLFFFFVSNGEQMMEAFNKATVKDAYNLLSDAKAKYTDLAVTSYEQTDDSVNIEFKYYETVLEKEDVDFQTLNYEVKTYLEEYLSDHPEDFINTGKRRVTLSFPNAVYTNVNPSGDFEFSAELKYVSYRYSDISAGEFLGSLKAVKKAESLTFESGDKVLDFGSEPDFTCIEGIEGLKSLSIEKNSLTEDQKKALEEICKKNEIELKTE